MKKRTAVLLLSALLLTAGVLGAQARGVLPVYGQTGTLVPWAYLPLISRAEPGPSLAGCPMFPADNIWNHRVDTLPVHTRSAEYVASIGNSTHLHPDFGEEWEGEPIGIPYVVVPGTQPKFYVDFDYDDESDLGPYPIPPNPPIEGGSDSHILMVDKDNCKLYELYAAYYDPTYGWQAGSGAIFDLRSNLLRPDGWTSADAAGLPILPGLVRYDEVASGVIRHAIRFTAQQTQAAYVWPARHEASDITNLSVPPMGQRFRLKASFNISGYPAEVRVILQAFKDYGIILADNGSNWYISGVPDERWDNDVLGAIKNITGSNFEAVDSSGLMIDEDSGQARP